MPASIEDQIIEVYSVAMQEYMKYISISDAVKQSKHSMQIVQTGWSTLSHIFNIVYIQTRNLETTYRSFQKAYLVYLEYVEQIVCSISMQTFESHGVVNFVYNKIFNEIDSKKTKNAPVNFIVIDNDLLKQMNQFSEVVYHWSNSALSISDRHDLGEQFLQSYLLMFHRPENANWIHIFNEISEKGLTDKLDVNGYSTYLTEIYYFAKKRRLPEEKKLRELCLFQFRDSNIEQFRNSENAKLLLEFILN
jgi:hypothetical protein